MYDPYIGWVSVKKDLHDGEAHCYNQKEMKFQDFADDK